MNWLDTDRTIILAAGIAALLLSGLLAWTFLASGPDEEAARSLTPLDSPATARLDRDMARALDLMDALERGEEPAAAPCERCAYLSQVAAGYRDRAEAALAGIRTIEAELSVEKEGRTQAARVSLERSLDARQRAAGRAIAGLGSFTDAIARCQEERLCAADDQARKAETTLLDCARDGKSVRAAAMRIAALADLVVHQARRCQQLVCPVMACDRSAGLAADLEIAEISLAELAGGRTALPGVAESGPATGLATVLGGVERALVRLALDSAEASLEPDALAARAQDMRAGLGDWVGETERRRGVQKEAWRVSALMGEIDVAAQWARAGGSVEHTRAYFEALSRAMLSAARLDAALAISERNEVHTANGPVCGASELANAYLKTGQALAALGYCRAKSACAPVNARRPQGRLRSASDREIGAFAAVAGALPLGLKRASDAAVRNSAPPAVTLGRPDFLAGEVIPVSVDSAPSACLVNGGSVGLARAGTSTGLERRFQLDAGVRTELLLAAPVDAGRYTVRVFASPDRGGHLLSEHALAVGALEPGCEGFTGVWETQFGRLRLVDREGHVTGSYRRSDNAPLPGLIVGTRSGRSLEGTWLSELGRGGTRLRLSADGSKFRGTWGVTPDRTAGGGPWTGSCLGPAR